MEWIRGGHHGGSDPWRVSLLVRAFLDLVLALCVLLCVVVSVATARLIDATRVFPRCVSYAGAEEEAASTGLPEMRNHESGPTGGRSGANWSPHRIRRDPNNPMEDDDFGDCSSACDPCAQMVSPALAGGDSISCAADCCDERKHRRLDNTGGTPNLYSPSSGRPIKRKFCDVSPTDMIASPCKAAAAHGFLKVACFTGEQTATSISELEDKADQSPARRESTGRFTPEEWSGLCSSQESFSYSRRSALADAPRRNGGANLVIDVSIDSDLLGGEITPESEAGVSLAMDGGGNWGCLGPTAGVEELRAALEGEKATRAALYAELEEERNAASSAAHEAMAMIRRLQEEKAAVQMEARQYQRMAEERQLYDEEALAVLQDILGRRDEQLYALEEEVNVYRSTLATLGVDPPTDDRDERDGSCSPETGKEILLIERETTTVEGGEAWRKDMEGRDERLLVDIRDWLRAANEKALRARAEGVDQAEVTQKSSMKVGRVPLGSGRKNLLEAFGSVGSDQRGEYSAVDADVDSTTDAASAGYESYKGMMESLRKEPNLRDEESLETLKAIEEKFQRQSSKEFATSGDELRQIWKSTLRSFENDDEGLYSSPRARASSASPENGGNLPDEEVDVNSEDDSSKEEKRMSVLEYVWKFEEQLHHLGQQAGKPAGDLAMGQLMELDGGSELPPRTSPTDDQSTISLSNDYRPKSIKTRLRRLAASARNATSRAGGDQTSASGSTHSIVRPGWREDAESQDATAREGSEGSAVVHDVYEVKQAVQESVQQTTKGDLSGLEVKSFVSSGGNGLVRGEAPGCPETFQRVEEFLDDDRLGKPDSLPCQILQEVEARNSGDVSPNGLGNCTVSTKGAGSQESADLCKREGDLLEPTAASAALSSPGRLSDSLKPGTEDVVQQLSHRLQSLETDQQAMQQTIGSLRKENGDMKLLQEIAQQFGDLRELKQPAMNSTNPSWASGGPPVVPAVKGILSFNGFYNSVQSQLSKMSHLFLGPGEPGAFRGEQQQARPCRPLHKSPPSDQRHEAEATHFHGVDAVNNKCSVGDDEIDVSPPRTYSLSALLSQESWPLGTKERSETAFSGWDN